MYFPEIHFSKKRKVKPSYKETDRTFIVSKYMRPIDSINVSSKAILDTCHIQGLHMPVISW